MRGGGYSSFSQSTVVVNLAAYFCKRLKKNIFLFLDLFATVQIYVKFIYLFINACLSFIINIRLHSPLFLSLSVSLRLRKRFTNGGRNIGIDPP